MGHSPSKSAFVEGHVEPGFESVKELFQQNILSGKERNAQLCVYVDGQVVVDLWGSNDGDKDYNADSLQCVFSSSKAVTAIAVAQLAERGLLNYDNPIANYWPEFRANLKSNITIGQMLKHEGGMPHLHLPVSYEDLLPFNLTNGKVASILCQQEPIYPVDTPREYHNLTAGWVINEVFRRQSPNNESIGSWIDKEISKPLDVDVYCGVPDGKSYSRISSVSAMSQNEAIFESLLPKFLGSKVDYNIIIFMKLLNSFNKRFVDPDPRGFLPDIPGDISSMGDPVDWFVNFMNSKAWRQGESPHGNVHASARGLAKVAGAMANKGALGNNTILTVEGWNMLHDKSTVEIDAAMGKCRTQFTQGGVNKFVDYPDDSIPERIFKSGRNGFIGWLGFGGSVMQWHPGRNIGFGYTCTMLTWWDLSNANGRKLQKEVIKCTEKIQNEKVDINNSEQMPVLIPVSA